MTKHSACRVHHLTFAALFAVSASVAGAPYDLDPTFGEGGRAWIADQDAFRSAKLRHMLSLPDGSTVLVTQGSPSSPGGQLTRFLASGERDTDFGDPRGVFGGECPLPTHCYVDVGPPASQPDGKIVIPLLLGLNASTLFPAQFGVVRLLQDGRRDPSFGIDGVAVLPPAPFDDIEDFGVAAIGVDSHGRITIAGTSGVRGIYPPQWSFARFLANGAPDTSFGPSGRKLPGVPTEWVFFAFGATRDGGFMAAGWAPYAGVGTLVARFLPSGELDSRFEVFMDPRASGVRPTSVVERADGAVVVGGYANVDGIDQFAALRLQPDGKRDPSFGIDGQVTLTMVPGWGSRVVAIALDSKQRIVMAGLAYYQQFGRIGVARLLPDGQPDTTFGAGGKATHWEQYGARPNPFSSAMGISPGDKIVLNAAVLTAPAVYDMFGFPIIKPERPALFRLRGGDGNAPIAQEQRSVIEYFHAGFGHYFLTPLQQETYVLDARTDWVRTGRSFRAWMDAGPALDPACRFFSGDSFAPKSSHFYTSLGEECSQLRAGSAVWTFEGSTFYLRRPEPVAGTATCPAGTQPLYRAYNNGQGGAPNHRYTSDPETLDQMIAQGWSMEGEASSRIYACIPVSN